MKFAVVFLLVAAAVLQNAPPAPATRVSEQAFEEIRQALRSAAPFEPGSIEGMIVDASNGRPLSLATVQLQARGGIGSAGMLVTNTRDDGSFIFRNVPAGPYSIQADYGGYIPEQYGNAPDPYNTSTSVLKPGQKASGILLSLTRAAVISGRLIDDRGDVVAGTLVQALKTTYKDGLRERKVVQSTVSNDLGEYRLFMLRPGEYHIAVIPSTLTSSPIPNSAIPFYFPGTIDVRASQSLQLHVGETLAGINFTAIPTRTRRITGSVQGHGDDSVGVVLSPMNGTTSVQQTLDPNDPVFQFSDVAPGSYVLLARSPSLRSTAPVDVRNADMLNLRLSLGGGFRIPAHIRIEGHSATDDPELEKVYFVIRPETAVAGLEGDTYSPFPDGHITFDLPAGDYHIDITRPEGSFVKSAVLNGVDVLDRGLHVTGSTDGPLEILISSNTGSTEGRVESGAVRDATVVLVPDAARRGQRLLFKSIKVDAGGAFRFEKVPPGDYKVFAWAEENGGPWLDPEYLGKYEDRGTPVRIDPSRRTILERPVPVF